LRIFIELFPGLILLTSALPLSNPFAMYMGSVLVSLVWIWMLDRMQHTLFLNILCHTRPHFLCMLGLIKVGREPLLIDEHWYVSEHMLKFLGLLYLSIVLLFSVYYPTSL
jgi:hypothetical protein